MRIMTCVLDERGYRWELLCDTRYQLRSSAKLLETISGLAGDDPLAEDAIDAARMLRRIIAQHTPVEAGTVVVTRKDLALPVGDRA